MKANGYWKSKAEDNYPDPNLLQGFDYLNFLSKYYLNKSYIVSYLNSGIPCNFYKGFSTCRICGKILGSFERNDGLYIWPEKLSHYVEEHNVYLPEYFLLHIINSYDKIIEKDFNEWLDFNK